MCRWSDLVHLVNSHSQLSDAKRTHQEGMLSGLTACLETCFKLSSAGIHHKHCHISLEKETKVEDKKRVSVSAEVDVSITITHIHTVQ